MGSRCGQASGCKGGEVDVREAEDNAGAFSGPPGPGLGEAAAAEEVVASRHVRMPSGMDEAQELQDDNISSDEEDDEEDDDDDEDDNASLTEQVWSTVIEIDRGFPFDFVWPGLKVSIFRALRAVSNTWPAVGWQNEADLEATLRRAVEAEGAGAVARGLHRSQAERIAEHLRGELPCSVRLDREGAAAVAAIAASAPQEDGPRRERLRRRLRELRERAAHDDVPLAGMGLLHHIERDLEDDDRWRSRAVAMAHALDRLQTLGPDLMDPFSRALSLASMGRKLTISVNREELLNSALGPVLSAAPHDLCPGRLCMKYQGEEGEDGDGGGGVTRAFLTHAGELIARPQLGLLLPSSEGLLLLSPLPGFLAPDAAEAGSAWQQPERWCRFLGRLLGMATVHECPLGVTLAPSFCRQLLDQEPCFEDLRFVPGLSDGGSGWYSTLCVLLANRAPELLKEDPTLVRLDDVELEKALAGLDAAMPSRSQLVFEALACYVGRAAHSPKQWVGAADTAASLLEEAKTSAQRKLAMCKAKELVDGVLLGDRELPPDMPRALQTLRLAIQAAGALQAMGKDLGDLGGPEEQGRAGGAWGGAAEEEPRRWAEGRLAQIQSWRLFVARGPGRVLGAWRDAAQRRRGPAAAAQRPERPEGAAGEAAPEGQQRPRPSLERSLSNVQGPGFHGGEALSAANLQAFAKAVAAKALAENLKPHIDTVVEEFRRVVALRVRGGLSWQQLQQRISGRRLDPVSFVSEWREKTTYQACTEEHESVRLWWSYSSELAAEDLLRLFAWCTGFAAIPATAWKFRINVVDDIRRCPTVNTCMTDDTSAANRGVKMPTLYLPAYDSKATLAKKMEWAIAGASGIHLH